MKYPCPLFIFSKISILVSILMSFVRGKNIQNKSKFVLMIHYQFFSFTILLKQLSLGSSLDNAYISSGPQLFRSSEPPNSKLPHRWISVDVFRVHIKAFNPSEARPSPCPHNAGKPGTVSLYSLVSS